MKLSNLFHCFVAVIVNIKENSLMNAAVSTSKKVIRIVALHGRGGNSLTFTQKLKPLINALSSSSLASTSTLDWIIPNAPHVHIDKNNVDSKNEFEWWSLPPNTRSYNSTVYYGVDDSIKMIERLHPHILIGHSQGAMLTSILMSRSIMKLNPEETNAPSLGILSCAAFPQPFKSLLHNLRSTDNNTSANSNISRNKPTILHVVSKQDKTNPYESGLEVATVFERCTSRNIIKTHDLGHKLCMEDELLQVYKELILSTVTSYS